MRRLTLSAALALVLPAAAAAEDVALVMVNAAYDRLSDLRIADDADAAVDALAAAGFAVIEIRDASFAEAAEALAAARERLAAADRLAILVGGHLVNDGGATWLLAGDARAPDEITVGAEGIPLAPIARMAAAHPGAAVVLVSDGGARLRLGPGLAQGAAPVTVPQGVTVFSGPMRGLVGTLRDGLLVPGTSLAAVAGDLPADVAAGGFLSDRVAFSPAEGEAPVVLPAPVAPPAADPEAVEAALALGREARRAVQRDLELLGYDPGGIDGIFGRGTRSAIRDWQEDNAAPGTGFLTGNQVVLLQEQGARRSAELEAEAAARQAEEDRRDLAYWEETGAGGSEEGLRAYLARYPDGLYAVRARAALEPFEAARREAAAAADREAWDMARARDSAEAYRDYLARFPEGAFRREAEDRLATLDRDEGDAAAIRAAEAEEGAVAGNVIARILIEQRLAQLGADPGPPDGAFTEETRRAIRRFQRARDLPVTGYVTQATMARLLAP